MEQLDFPEIARLLTYSRTTQINPEPVRKENTWSLYEGVFRVHTSSYPFFVLYLQSKVTNEEIDRAAHAIAGRGETHVVYPPSLAQRVQKQRRVFPASVKGFWTAKEYLTSFIKQELEQYTSRLQAQAPPFYIDPPVETPSGWAHKVPNPILSLLMDPDPGGGPVEGALGVLLAEPGQGKTYMSRYLVHRLSKAKEQVLPILIDSSQWQGISPDDFKSLWKTITHSFRHFDAPIGWLDGHEDEFIRATLKADLVRIVFDGFDEYVLRNRGSVNPFDVLDALAELAAETGARIAITSRSSFWHTNLPEAAVHDFLTRTGTFVYTILPFDAQHARNYFTQRLSDPKRITIAVQLYGTLRNQNEDLVGRGFVLSLIADLVERSDGKGNWQIATGNQLMWLMEALCQREVLRQQLPLSSVDQLGIFGLFAAEVSTGQDPDTSLLDLTIEAVRSDLDSTSRGDCIEKLKSHPLLELKPSTGRWRFREAQLGIGLLADRIVRSSDDQLGALASKLALEAGDREDLAVMIVDVAGRDGATTEARELLRRLAGGISQKDRVQRDGPMLGGEGPKLGASICLKAVDRLLPKGTQHADRAQLLLELSGGSPIKGFVFSGTIARYDLRKVVFDSCRFERITWANCTFDDTTLFRRCVVVGGMPPAQCVGFGSVVMEDCVLDQEATTMINAARVSEGRKTYTLEDLRNDVCSVINKFLIKGGVGLKTIAVGHIMRGPISASRYKDDIIGMLRAAVLEEHHISGRSDKGYHVRPDAEEALKFYAANNVFTGPLQAAFERLQKKLRLS